MPAVAMVTTKVAGYAIATEMAAKVAAAVASAEISAAAVTAAMGGIGCRYKSRQRQGCACGGQHAYVSLHMSLFSLSFSSRALMLIFVVQ